MTAETIHTCSYECERPGCIRAQRDELVARLTAAMSQAAEAQGVVDGWRLVVRYGEYDSEPGVWAEKDGSLVWIAALTGERNG